MKINNLNNEIVALQKEVEILIGIKDNLTFKIKQSQKSITDNFFYLRLSEINAKTFEIEQMQKNLKECYRQIETLKSIIYKPIKIFSK